MPPSINKAYGNNTLPGRRGRFKTSAYSEFEHAAKIWALANAHTLNIARELTKDLSNAWVFKIDMMFHFREAQIVQQNDGRQSKAKPWMARRLAGEPKSNDTSNRIKVLEDVLASLLGIDDCFFWCGSYDKRPILQPAFPNYVDIQLTLIEMPGSNV